MVFAVTGASGYVGGRIAERLRSKGHKVYSLGRVRSGETDPYRVPFNLEDVEHRFPKDTEVLIHCAYDFKPHRSEQIEKVNGDGSIRVFESAMNAGIPHRIFISTISAYEGCVSKYGKVKLRVEQSVLRSGGVVLRPGLVYGKQMGGMMGTLAGLIEKTPVVPLIGSGRQRQYLIMENDLGDLTEYFAMHPERRPDRPVTAAHPEAMTFREILSAIAASKGRNVRFLPVPWKMVWLALKTTEVVGLGLNMRSDSVVSLEHQNPSPDFSALAETGIDITRFRDTL
jgi:nucleoside-diphosphate-sugar epimerase